MKSLASAVRTSELFRVMMWCACSALMFSCTTVATDKSGLVLDAYFFGDHREQGEFRSDPFKINIAGEVYREHVRVRASNRVLSALMADTIEFTSQPRAGGYWGTIATVVDSSGNERYRVVICSRQRVIINTRVMRHPEWMVREIAALFSKESEEIILDAYASDAK